MHLRHPTNRWYRPLRVPVAHPDAETACSRGMKDTDVHGALIYKRIFEMFSLKIFVHHLCALADGSTAFAAQVHSLCASVTAVYLPFFVFGRVLTRVD